MAVIDDQAYPLSGRKKNLTLHLLCEHIISSWGAAGWSYNWHAGELGLKVIIWESWRIVVGRGVDRHKGIQCHEESDDKSPGAKS